MVFSHIREVSKQSSKKTEFTINLIWWGSPQLSEIVITELATNLLEPDIETLQMCTMHS